MNKKIIISLLFLIALVTPSCQQTPSSSLSQNGSSSSLSSSSDSTSDSSESSFSNSPSSDSSEQPSSASSLSSSASSSSSSSSPSSSSSSSSSSLSSSSSSSNSSSIDPNIDPDDLWEENTGGEEGFDENLPAKSGPTYDKYTYRPIIGTKIPEITVSLSFDPAFNAIPKLEQTYLTTASRLNKGDYYGCSVSVTNYDEEDLNIIDKNCEIKVRGNYTANYSKKPFRLKFEKKTQMPGFEGSFKNWVLLADVKDQSLQRNAFSFYMGQMLLGTDGYYSSNFRPVELYFIDGTGTRRYWGAYLLVEQQEIKPGRVDITDIDDMVCEDGIAGNYTGTDIGYFFEFDAYYDEQGPEPDPTFVIDYFNNSYKKFQASGSSIYPNQKGYTIKSNLSGSNNANQLAFIKSYTQNVYRIIYEATYNNAAYVFNENHTAISLSTETTPREAIARAIDIKSLVDTYIMSEVVCDPDVDWSSFYMDVDFGPNAKDNLLRFEAPWDFDSCFAVRREYSHSGIGYYAAISANPWLGVIVNNQWFMNLVKEKYQELYAYDFLKDMVEFLDNTANSSLYEAMYERNIDRWGTGDLTGEVRAELRAFTTQKQHSNWLKNWVLTRLNWLSTTWLNGFDVVTHEKLSPGEFELSAGNIALKTNGTKYRFEAENALYAAPIAARVNKPETNASNASYLGDVANNPGKTITFEVTATKRKQCYLVACVSAKAADIPFTNMFTITVNENPLLIRNIIVPAVAVLTWRDWTEIDVYSFWLEPGENIIIFTVGSNSSNFDYIDLYSKDTLTF